MQAHATLISFPVDFKLSRFRIIYSHHIVVTLSNGSAVGIGSGVLYRATAVSTYNQWQQWLHKSLTNTPLPQLLAPNTSPIPRLAAIEPGLAFAVDTALWDLHAKQNGRSLAHLLGGVHHNPIPITEQIFIDDWATSEKELQTILARGTTRLKVKTGFSPSKDIALVQQIRDFVGPNIELRVDANRAYPLADSLDMYKKLADLGVLAAEEPISDKDKNALSHFRQKTGLPVMLDESILTLNDLEAAIAANAIDSLNFKLTRIGGITPALAFRQRCQEAGIAVSLGCNEDLGPGMAAILHLAAACPDLYSTEGIGHLRLDADFITQPMPIVDGAVALPTGDGLGVALTPNFPNHLNGRCHIYDLSSTNPFIMQAYSRYVRTRQRATNVIYRLNR